MVTNCATKSQVKNVDVPETSMHRHAQAVDNIPSLPKLNTMCRTQRKLIPAVHPVLAHRKNSQGTNGSVTSCECPRDKLIEIDSTRVIFVEGLKKHANLRLTHASFQHLKQHAKLLDVDFS